MSTNARKYLSVMRVLQGRIVRGVYEDKLPGVRQLAAELGASQPTVSMALTRLEGLGIVTCKARQGTFVVPQHEPAPNVRQLRVRLAIALPPDQDAASTFWNIPMIYGFQRAAHARGLHMELVYTESVEEAVDQCVTESRTDNCIGTCLLGVPLAAKHVLALTDAMGPILCVDAPVEEPFISTLGFDNAGAGRVLGSHLLALGHRRIGYVGSGNDSIYVTERVDGVRGRLAEESLELLTPDRLFEEPQLNYALRIVRRKDGPTAIVMDSLSVARHFLRLATAVGLRVPEDVSVAAFGDARGALTGDVTYMKLDNVGLGERALEMLSEDGLMEQPRQEFFPASLVADRTTAPPLAD